MIGFLNSIALWGWLAAGGVAIPIIIHLLSRFRSRPLDWAAMELLRRAMMARARRMRVEDLILLLLRCLAALLVALALARPALKRTSGGSGQGGGGAGVLIAMDASYSMTHQPGLYTRFDRAREKVSAVLGTLAPGDPCTLVLLGSRPRVLLRNVAYDSERAAAALKAATPLAEPVSLEVCLEELVKLAAEIKAPSRECYLITDAQATTWKDISESAQASLRTIRKSCTLFFVPAGPSDAENVAVTRLAVVSGMLRKGSLARYAVDVRNTGAQPAANVTVSLQVDNAPVDQRVIERISPGETVTAPLFARFDASGTFGVSASLGKDSLSLDNARYAVAHIRESLRVLCVDGDPSGEPFRGEAGFLAAALRPEGVGAAAGLQAEVITLDRLRPSGLPAYDIIFLANVAEVSYEQAAAFADFVRRGGGLVVYLGSKVSPEIAERRFKDTDGTPLLPAVLSAAVGEADERRGIGEAAAARSDGWTLSTELPQHPLTGIFSAMPREQWTAIRFRRYFPAAPREDARVLLKLTPGDGPLLVESAMGRGKVLLFTSTANREWNDMPVHPAYLMLVQQMVTYLSRKPHETSVTASEEIVFALPAEGVPSAVPVRDPQGEETSIRITDRGGQKVAVVASADRPGFYSVRWAEGVPGLSVAVNVDPAESAVAVLEGNGLDQAARGMSARLVTEGQDIAAAARESRLGRELTHALLIAALAVLVIEALLGRFFARSLSAAPEPAVGIEGAA